MWTDRNGTLQIAHTVLKCNVPGVEGIKGLMWNSVHFRHNTQLCWTFTGNFVHAILQHIAANALIGILRINGSKLAMPG